MSDADALLRKSAADIPREVEVSQVVTEHRTATDVVLGGEGDEVL